MTPVLLMKISGMLFTASAITVVATMLRKKLSEPEKDWYFKSAGLWARLFFFAFVWWLLS